MVLIVVRVFAVLDWIVLGVGLGVGGLGAVDDCGVLFTALSIVCCRLLVVVWWVDCGLGWPVGCVVVLG